MASRNRSGPLHLNVPLNVFHSEEIRGLSHAEHRVLMVLAAEYNGRNNGAIGVTKRQAKRHGLSGKTLYAALSKLVDLDLIRFVYPSSKVPARPTMYALTWRALDDTPWTDATAAPLRIFRGNPRNQK